MGGDGRLHQPKMCGQVDDPTLTQSKVLDDRETGRVAQAAEQTRGRGERRALLLEARRSR